MAIGKTTYMHLVGFQIFMASIDKKEKIVSMAKKVEAPLQEAPLKPGFTTNASHEVGYLKDGGQTN